MMLELTFYLLLVANNDGVCLYQARSINFKAGMRTEILYRIERLDKKCPSSIVISIRESNRATWAFSND